MSQQMHDYVTSQLQKGFSREQIKQALLSSGWPAQEIDNYFLTLPTPSQSKPIGFALQKNLKFILPAIVILLVIAGGTFYLLGKKSSSTTQTPESTIQTQETSPMPSIDPSPAAQQNAAPAGATFEEHLSTCTPYKGTFEHPLTGETMEREIVGEADGKCHYVEQMPNGGKMECRYTEYDQRAIAQYYLDLEAAESVGTNVTSDGVETTAEYTVDGKVVENPLAEALENGTCVISGY